MNPDTDGSRVQVACAGDAALVVEFPTGLDAGTHGRVTATADALRARWSAVLRDVVVGYSSVTVYYDPLRVDASWLEGELRVSADEAEGTHGRSRVIEVPVCYDPPFSADLDAVAAFAGCTAEEVVALHTSRRYRVYMMGFVPGFAYMAHVDPRIAAPRRAEPRASVPSGAVAIAGAQTGIYPCETPGGWNIIGRTPLRLWDDERDEPSLFRPGDLVEFVRTGADALERAG